MKVRDRLRDQKAVAEAHHAADPVGAVVAVRQVRVGDVTVGELGVEGEFGADPEAQARRRLEIELARRTDDALGALVISVVVDAARAPS